MWLPFTEIERDEIDGEKNYSLVDNLVQIIMEKASYGLLSLVISVFQDTIFLFLIFLKLLILRRAEAGGMACQLGNLLWLSLTYNYWMKRKVTSQGDRNVCKGMCGLGSDTILLYDKKELILISLHMNTFQGKKKMT